MPHINIQAHTLASLNQCLHTFDQYHAMIEVAVYSIDSFTCESLVAHVSEVRHSVLIVCYSGSILRYHVSIWCIYALRRRTSLSKQLLELHIGVRQLTASV